MIITKIFIAGSIAIKAVDEQVSYRLRGICTKNHTVLLGDANGVDKAVQQFMHNANYNKVLIYASNGRARNNLGNWPVIAVDVPSSSKGFDFYKCKDQAMSDDADYGFMIWDGESRGTLNNLINLITAGKSALIYLVQSASFVWVNNANDLRELVLQCPETTWRQYETLANARLRVPEQLSFI